MTSPLLFVAMARLRFAAEEEAAENPVIVMVVNPLLVVLVAIAAALNVLLDPPMVQVMVLLGELLFFLQEPKAKITERTRMLFAIFFIKYLSLIS